MKDYYSDFKVAHHQDKLEQLKKNEYITPVFVQWDLTNRCNLACKFCFYRIYPLSDFIKDHEMSERTVYRVLKEIKEIGIKAIEWTGGGEPILHPAHKRIFAKAKKMGFEQSLVTNGTLLDMVDIYIIRDFEWVRFSVDSSTPETYKNIKGVDFFDTVIKNMKKLIDVKSENNIVGFSFIVTPDNYKEILTATHLAKDIGCNNIRFSLAMTPRGNELFDNIWNDITAEIELAKNEETKEFKVFAFSNRIYQLSKDVLSDACYYCQFVGVIAPAGIYPCCRLKDDGRFNFGNLENRTFNDIWFSWTRKKFVDRVKKGCPFDCWMVQKNNFCKYLIQKKEDAAHVNFI